ncbi:Hypothetical protein A7982_10198 [Minicystis rosea]|nr:Hypothetical protein A7982_10198 [Minicystis rosea]
MRRDARPDFNAKSQRHRGAKRRGRVSPSRLFAPLRLCVKIPTSRRVPASQRRCQNG